MELEKDYFRKLSPADVINRVSTIGLTEISRWGDKYLRHVGWLDNVVVDKLYTITSAGQWIARTDTSGRIATVEQNSALILGSETASRYTNVAGLPPSITGLVYGEAYADAIKLRKICAQLNLSTDGSGVKAATQLHLAAAGYFPVVRLKRIISTVAEATTILNFTVSAGALIGPATMTIALVANVMYELNDILLYDATDATSISVAIDSGPISGTIWLEYEYWSET